MMFLYTGISSGNGSLWLKLNYNDKAVAQCPRECQYSSWIEVKVQKDLKNSATENILKQKKEKRKLLLFHNVPDLFTEYEWRKRTHHVLLMCWNIEKYFKTEFPFNTMIHLLLFIWLNLYSSENDCIHFKPLVYNRSEK